MQRATDCSLRPAVGFHPTGFRERGISAGPAAHIVRWARFTIAQTRQISAMNPLHLRYPERTGCVGWDHRPMASTSRMRQRAARLRQQAAVYRRLARLPRNAPLRDRLEGLATQCADIAASIERGLASGVYHG